MSQVPEGETLEECLNRGGTVLTCMHATDRVGDPKTAPDGTTKYGTTGLSDTDKDCASNSLLGFITEPACVAGKSITKGTGGLGFLGDKRIWIVVAAVIVLILVAVIRGR